MGPEDTDRYLGKVLKELRFLPEYAEDWTPDPEGIDALDAYASEWASVALGRMNRLERAHRSGAMSAEQQARYSEVKALFRKRMPLIERFWLDKPTVPLED